MIGLSAAVIAIQVFAQTVSCEYWTTATDRYWNTKHTARPTSTPFAVSSAYGGGGPTATIDAGILIGTTTSLPAATASVNKYLGIPFAKPPIRFAPPEKPANFGTINATAWRPACIQQFQYPLASQLFAEAIFNNPAPQESEDCLYLNVYAPSTPAPADGRSVMYWIYGGSLQFGNAGQIYYDGSSFASYEDVIVVTVNYRTNVFGFPTTNELPATGHNLGFLDQRLGLDWVQRNIKAFGGSPNKVTIFGESAGAFSVDALLTSFPANSTPPFRAAILQSGQYSYAVAPKISPAQAQVPWAQLSAALGCPGTYASNLTCLRAANATAIKDVIEKQELTFSPIADNVTLVQNPAQQRISGNIARIPILSGTDAQEGRVFAVGQTNFTAYITGLFGASSALVEAITAAYPPSFGSDYDRASAVFTDYVFTCPTALVANDTAALGTSAWRYYFNASFPNTQAYPGLGVYHSSEIPIVFGTYPKTNVTTQEYALSNSMMGAWTRFAKNPAGGPGWNGIGTGTTGVVLEGATQAALGGMYTEGSGDVVDGSFDLGLFGNRGDAQGSGVTVVDQIEADSRCGVFVPVYKALTGLS
ncbi:hypothetical protein LTR95_012405 [Oleoguttula sp. CCFEE 5521]